ncbi:hypothetical protein [Vibrio cyclitrophicus]|uniref:hypothetical protein n=1 Tax=Vibrio cyclitrophicus TaxID=47951 RepID=UPI000C8677FF|nr:hypothetical protein [Vibrio cyclitrophicus]PMH74904.1 hypothetical protein BCU59_19400 [Vibrio cyclitrophicus]
MKANDDLINFICAEFFHEVYGSLRCELSIEQKAFLFKKAKEHVKLEAKSAVRELRAEQKRKEARHGR